MRRVNRLFALAALLAAGPLAAQTIALTADPQPTASVRLKAVDLPVRVGINFDRALFLNLEPARKAGLKPFPIVGKIRIKNSLLPGGEALIRANFFAVGVDGGKPARTPTVWFDKLIETRAQGVVSIFAFDAQQVIVRQPSAPASGVRHVLNRAGANDSHVELRLGGEKVRLMLDLNSPRTMMNARAAAALEAEGLVTRGREVGLWTPVPGVNLPYQRLLPTAAAKLAGLPLVSPGARVTEDRAREIDAAARAGTSTEADEEDAIVVTASRDGARGRSPWIMVGQDMLGRCAQITLDRPGRTWVLDCAS